MDCLSIALPSNVENLLLPAPELITFYKNLDERVLWLDTEVDDLYLEFGRYIVQFNREDRGIPPEERKPIKLMFFSPGGSLSINNSLIDIIKLSRTPVWGCNIGVAHSAGCFIYMACHRRLALPHSVFLIHKGSGEFGGSYDEVIAQVVEYQRQIDELAQYILDNTKISKEMLEENLGTDWYICATDALRLGICDEIITSLDDIA